MTDEVEQARLALADKTVNVATLRADPLIQRIIQSFKKSKSYNIDEDMLSDEIKSIHVDTAVKVFALEGVDGLDKANDIRFHIIGGRGRLVRINRDVRKVLLKGNRIWKTGLAYIRNHPDSGGLTIKALEELAAVVLVEVRDVVEACERLMADTKETIVDLDERQRTIDSWFTLHKQYTFLTLSKGPQNGNENNNENTRRSSGLRRT